jgi:hypothetical protein
MWAALLPVLACAVCPVCLATYAKLASVLGVGFGLSELQHTVLLVIAIALSVAVSAWRSVRTRRIWPVLIAMFGSALVSLGHFAGKQPALEWAGVLVLMIGGVTEHYRLREDRFRRQGWRR